MLISHTGRWIFFACGRTGTTSIERVLASSDEGDDVRQAVKSILDRKLERPLRPPDIKHVRPEVVRQVMGREWDDYFKFVYVRNPWDWVVSQYLFNIRPGFLKRRAIRKLDNADLDRLMHILAFRHPQSNPGNWQCEYVFDRHGERLVDHVCRFESLQADFDAICKRLNLPPTILPLTNHVGRLDYRAYYTDACSHASTAGLPA